MRKPSRIVEAPPAVHLWEAVDIVVRGPQDGNPYLDVELRAEVHTAERTYLMNGFYNGGGLYVVRLLADTTGLMSFRIRSSTRAMDGLTGSIEVKDARQESHGPVQVDGRHFRHADGSVHRPVGTTAYGWLHPPESLQQQTLATLASSPFRKIRMCVFPTWFDYTHTEPSASPFPRAGEGWDLDSFDAGFFTHLDDRVRQLADRNIEADLILFHPYDKWGFGSMPSAVDDRYVRYVVRRLASFSNVWWSLANEYDLLTSKSVGDWNRLAEIIAEEDPYRHLTSIHQSRDIYDQARPWISHVSVQRLDSFSGVENITHWRERWGKPVIVDECGYEGDVGEAWGNLTAEELTRAFWEGTLRGGYVGHGETYLNDAEELWWSKGGELVGGSPSRIAFLERVCADAALRTSSH